MQNLHRRDVNPANFAWFGGRLLNKCLYLFNYLYGMLIACNESVKLFGLNYAQLQYSTLTAI